MSNIRNASNDDRTKIINLIIDMIGDKNPEKVAKQVVNDLFENNKFKTLVILEQNIVAGFSVLKRDSFEGANRVAEIVWLAIDKKFRRIGLGNKLVDYIEEYAKREDIRKLYVKTSPNNKSAVCFWIMMDYQFEARMLDFSLNNLDDYYFGKKL
ncbi:ribosomal protein S18 acetylase RimI-like enzyme [Orenia metallireducens]|uniref:Ribosomal protein S18 acetylase RimI n=1 Tax=Orenia metallireducens TaxID=1413210 RepID=A0A285IGT7_9FIRM|nr:GNAT family N-acetyltransferase [Orenia metallireducens]PRX17817.1 ribosomal protein S18 acetylase RimI-like enzyme [Orenia metallireducens]SNY47184.1 Ribosomal protein S18 acetylase RimI [Orenia metallireducens]